MNKTTTKTLLALALIFCACSGLSAKTKKNAVTVNTTVTEISQNGNAYLAIKQNSLGAKGFSVTDIVTVTVNGKKIDMPICKDYSDVNSGEYLLRFNDENRACLAINMGNFAKEAAVAPGAEVTITLKQQYGYLTQYHQRMMKKSDLRSDYSSDEVFANFREVTAGDIVRSRLYRSSSLIENTPRAEYATVLAMDAQIKTIVNLSASEASEKPLVERNNYYKKFADSGSVFFADMTVSYADESFVSSLHDALVFIIEHDGPYLIHGTNGQNRTGIVIALLEGLCDATISEITDDYMASYVNYYGITKNSSQYKEMEKTIPALFQYINDGKKVSEKGAQKAVEKYLEDTVGLSENQVKALKKRLTE